MPDAPSPRSLRVLGRAVALLAAATLLALVATSVVVLAVAAADFLTAPAAAVVRVALGSGVLAVAAAASPLVAVLLVGYAYMQRGLRRRAALRASAAAGGPRAPRAGQPP